MLTFPDKNQLVRWLIKDKYQGDETSTAELQKDIARIESGEPIAYIIGWVNFLGCHIDLSKKTLIPRPETEYWVEQAIQEVAAAKFNSPRILDMCCGSGCIGIAALKQLPNSTVDFSDIDSNAVAQTQINVALNGIEKKRTQIFEADLFEKCSGTYDVILANPPYVSLSGEVGQETLYEPSHAIFAQKNGLELIEQIISSSKKYLSEGRFLYLEFGEGQEAAIQKLAQEAKCKTMEFREDQFGVIRWGKFSY